MLFNFQQFKCELIGVITCIHGGSYGFLIIA